MSIIVKDRDGADRELWRIYAKDGVRVKGRDGQACTTPHIIDLPTGKGLGGRSPENGGESWVSDRRVLQGCSVVPSFRFRCPGIPLEAGAARLARNCWLAEDRSCDRWESDCAFQTRATNPTIRHRTTIFTSKHQMSTPSPIPSSSNKRKRPPAGGRGSGEGLDVPDLDDLDIRPPSAPPLRVRPEGQDSNEKILLWLTS